MMVSKHTIILLLLLACVNSFADDGNKVDSLKKVMESCKNDTCRCKILLSMGDLFENTIPDSAIYYYNECLNLAQNKGLKGPEGTAYQYMGIVSYNQGNFNESIKYYLKAIEIYESINDRGGLTGCYNNIGLVYSDQGSFEMAKECYLKSMKLNMDRLADCSKDDCYSEKIGISNNLTNISIIYLHHGNRLKAIEYQLKALAIKEELLSNCTDNHRRISLKQGIARCYNNIGTIHYEQTSFKKASYYFNQALKLYVETDEQWGISYIYGNFGNLYSEMGLKANNKQLRDSLMDISLDYYNKSLEISKKLNDVGSMSSCYNNAGEVLSDLGRYDDAIISYKNAIELYEATGDKEGKSICYWNISDLYINLADSCSLTENQAVQYLKEAVKFGEESYAISKEINTLPTRNGAALALYNAYKKLGQFQNAIVFADIYISTSDSVFDFEHDKALTELSTKYETEKKEKENQVLRLDKQLHESAIKRQYILSISVSAGLLLMLFLAYVLYRSNKRRKKTNEILSNNNIEITQKNEEILTQRDEIASQRDLVTSQKDQIEKIHEELTSSIRYAQRIQQVMLPSLEILTKSGFKHFVVFKPRDIVSGDFYWVGRIDNKIVISVADCTGHGVPGAFMSMLGITYLKETVIEKRMSNPVLILEKVRSEIIRALKQEAGSDQRDGMDIALCTLNLDTLELQFAGANNPLYIIKSNPEVKAKVEIKGVVPSTSILTSTLTELKPDKMPIGIHERMDPFSLHTHQLQKDDCIYLFSDGMADQFGGPSGKKFKYKPLKDLLTANSQQPMANQKELLDKSFIEWKGNLEQVDDVTLVGIKIC